MHKHDRLGRVCRQALPHHSLPPLRQRMVMVPALGDVTMRILPSGDFVLSGARFRGFPLHLSYDFYYILLQFGPAKSLFITVITLTSRVHSRSNQHEGPYPRRRAGTLQVSVADNIKVRVWRC